METASERLERLTKHSCTAVASEGRTHNTDHWCGASRPKTAQDTLDAAVSVAETPELPIHVEKRWDGQSGVTRADLCVTSERALQELSHVGQRGNQRAKIRGDPSQHLRLHLEACVLCVMRSRHHRDRPGHRAQLYLSHEKLLLRAAGLFCHAEVGGVHSRAALLEGLLAENIRSQKQIVYGSDPADKLPQLERWEPPPSVALLFLFGL